MRTSPATLRMRLTLWYVGVLASLLLVYAGCIFAFQYVVLTRQLFHDEVQDVVTVEGLLSFDRNNDLQLAQNYYSRPQSHLLIDRLMEVRDLADNVLYRSATLQGMALGGPLRAGEGDAGFDERVVRLPDGSQAFIVSHIHTMQGRTMIIRLGYSLAPLEARMYQFFLVLLVAIPIALLLAGLAGQTIAKRALRPMEQMTARAERISASNLSERLEVANSEDELGHMARVFNHLLQRLEEAFQQLQRFSADAAHELRTPLAAIRAISEVTLEKAAGTEEYREAIGSLLEEAGRLSETVDSLLLLAKAERAPVAGAQTVFAVSELLDEVLGLLDVLAEERGLIVVKEGPELAETNVRADRSLMRIALVNVMHNALKFSPDNGTIRIACAERGSCVQVSVQDEGPGIALGETIRVFERFFTGDARMTGQKSGAGLGLSIAKLVIERNGGRIWFADGMTAGARCLIELPIVPVPMV